MSFGAKRKTVKAKNLRNGVCVCVHCIYFLSSSHQNSCLLSSYSCSSSITTSTGSASSITSSTGCTSSIAFSAGCTSSIASSTDCTSSITSSTGCATCVVKEDLLVICRRITSKEWKQVLSKVTVAVQVIKAKRVEVIHSIRTSINLNSRQYSSSSFETSLARLDNVLHEHILRLKESIRKFRHAIRSFSQTLSMRKDKFLHSTLLEVRKGLNLCSNGSSSFRNTLEVIGCSDGTSAALVNQSNSLTFYTADNAVLGDTNVWSLNNEAVSVIRDVCRHGTKAGVTSKGETSKTSQKKVLAKALAEVIFKSAGELVTAKRCSQKCVLSFKSSCCQYFHNLHLQFLV
mmetsp:Transcript_24604/g.36083  ORF Transcript_24604/g.36083 Transcript_24604/m.36083 type:complete len:345 (-) Transcript_24604:284-1318(-)